MTFRGPHRCPSPVRALNLWREKYDTLSIARFLGLHEAEAVRFVESARDLERAGKIVLTKAGHHQAGPSLLGRAA